MKKTLLIILAILLCGCSSTQKMELTTSTEEPNEENTNYSTDLPTETGELIEDWNHTYRVMAHALGGIDNYDYTNSLEAFVYNYNLGTRLFEIDLERVIEGDIVLTHTWEDFRESVGLERSYDPMSMEEFKNSKIDGQFTPVTFEELLDIMLQIKDFYVIIDSKTFDVDSTNLMYSQMIEVINEKDPSLIHRFVPQAYNPDIYEAIETYGFDKIIFTLYAYYVDSDGQKIYQFVKEKNIPVVVMHLDNDWAVKVISDVYSYAKMDDNLDQFTIYIHTVNDMEKALEIVNEYNFFGIYSDFISENEFEDRLG